MPRGKWSETDERKYEHIYDSCIFRARRMSSPNSSQAAKGRMVKHCKRIAAATVNRDRALASLGGRPSARGPARWSEGDAYPPVGAVRIRYGRPWRYEGGAAHNWSNLDPDVSHVQHDWYERTAPHQIENFRSAPRSWSEMSHAEREAAIDDAQIAYAEGKGVRITRRQAAELLAKRGLGAQVLSLSLPAGEFAGLRGPWQKGDRDLKSGAWFKRAGNRVAMLSDAEDPMVEPGDRGDVFLTTAIDRDGDIDVVSSDYFPTIEAATVEARRMGFDGLRGTPEQHRKKYELYTRDAASAVGPIDALVSLSRAEAEASWTGDEELLERARNNRNTVSNRLSVNSGFKGLRRRIR